MAKTWWQGERRRDYQPADSGESELSVHVGNAPIFDSDDGYAVWPASRVDDGATVTIAGALGSVVGGDVIECNGSWSKHAKHGWSFRVERYRSALPTSTDGIAKWMQMRIKGVGPTFAEAIVREYGLDTFSVLDANPELIREIRTAKGTPLPEATADLVIEEWLRMRSLRTIESFLFSHGVTASVAERLYRTYGDDVVSVLQSTPYAITDIRGIGFRTADEIALRMGVAAEDPARLAAGVLFVLEEAENEGHAFLGLPQLLTRVAEALRVTADEATVRAATGLQEMQSIVVEPDQHVQQRIYRFPTWEREDRVSARVRYMLDSPTAPLFGALSRPTEADGGVVPTEQQWQAVERASQSRLSILTGLPGTGKTATVKTIIAAAHAHHVETLLCAPTGKAARRLTDLSGEDARTIHRLLQWLPTENRFQHDADNPLDAGLVIVDEASMLSLELADHLIAAIGPHTHLVLVGDTDQLPPIGAGRVLDDLINSDRVPTTRLTKIFRQAAKSMIIVNAHRINRGEMPYTSHELAQRGEGRQMDTDFYWMPKANPDEARSAVVELVCDRIPRTFKIDAFDVMTLVPMHKGPLGLDLLNHDLQAALNPRGTPIGVHGIRVGDRVVQTQNDYSPGVELMNGQTCVVRSFDADDGTAVLQVDDGRTVTIPVPNMQSFMLAYAMSVHRSQGSQFKAVVTPVSSTHYVLMSRSLIYTAITRAESLVVMIGETKALNMAIRRADHQRRNSTLAPRIRLPNLSGALF